jgi:hypothetical protein
MNSLPVRRRDAPCSLDKFFSLTPRSSLSSVREFLQRNCTEVNLRSVAVGSVSYFFMAITVADYKNSPMISLISGVLAVASAILWHKWGNRPLLLAKTAWDAISKQDEATAVRAIRGGANIEVTNMEVSSGVSILRIPTLPFFPPIIFSMSTPVINMLTHAAENNCIDVVDLLLALGSHDNKSLLTALALTDSLEIAQKLVGSAVQLNQETGEYSPIALQIMRSCRGGPEIFQKSLAIIEFLLDSGARFNSRDLPGEKLMGFLSLPEVASYSLRAIYDKVHDRLSRL